MKKPLLNLEQRNEIRLDTLQGAGLKVYLESKKLSRAVYKEHGWIIMKIFNYKLGKIKFRTEWKEK